MIDVYRECRLLNQALGVYGLHVEFNDKLYNESWRGERVKCILVLQMVGAKIIKTAAFSGVWETWDDCLRVLYNIISQNGGLLCLDNEGKVVKIKLPAFKTARELLMKLELKGGCMNISAVNFELRKYLKKTGDCISKDDEDVLDVIEKVFGLEASFLVMPDRNPNSNQTVVSIDMSLKGNPVVFTSVKWQYNAGTIRTGAHNIVCALGEGLRCILSRKGENILIEIPPFKSAAELKMKLELRGDEM